MKESAGILLYRRRAGGLEVLLAHPGGPFWMKRDLGAWTIPKGGKVVHAWAIEGDCDAGAITSNRFTMEWPPRSGKSVEFPEIDRAAWFALEEARRRILEAQVPLLDELQRLLI